MDALEYEKARIRMCRTMILKEGGCSACPHTVDLIADNGDPAYGTVQDLVFILTCCEYRKYRELIPHYDSLIWTVTPWWCGDRDTGNAGIVRVVRTTGQLSYYSAYCSVPIAPACILNPASLNLRQSMAYVEEVSE